jgi:hypothetical protein
MLLQNRQALCDAYPATLLAEFAQGIASARRPVSGTLSFGTLELMDDDPSPGKT